MDEPRRSLALHFLTQSAEDPATRFRALAYRPGLEALGHTVRWDEIPPGGKERRLLLESCTGSDVVVLQRRLFNLRDQGRLRAASRALVFDFDDAIMFKDQGRGSMTRSGRFSRMVRSSDLVLAGNPYLVEMARAYNRHVELLPTVVDCTRFAPGRGDSLRTGELSIGWIGSRSTVGYLVARMPALAAAAAHLAEQGIACRFVVVCNEFGDLPESLSRAPVVRVPWSADEEVAWISSFDIGLMPLPDDPWTRGKCGFKLLEYLASGVAAVADPVGVNRDILAPADGGEKVGGRLASSDEEWVEAIVALATDPGARAAAARRGRERVERDWSLAVWLPRLAAWLDGVAAPRVAER